MEHQNLAENYQINRVETQNSYNDNPSLDPIILQNLAKAYQELANQPTAPPPKPSTDQILLDILNEVRELRKYLELKHLIRLRF